MANEIITKEPAPVGLQATLAGREKLWLQAVGYEVEEQDIIVGNDGSQRVVKRKRWVKGDPRAMELYLQLFGE